MTVLLFGKPLVFWMGFLVLTSFIAQIVSGIMMLRGRPKFLKYHKINALILVILVAIHIIFGLSLYL